MTTTTPLQITILVNATALARNKEALRAALGLGLRGDTVQVIIGKAAQPWIHGDDPDIRRALATLSELGHTLNDEQDVDVDSMLRTADAIEHWT